MAEYKIMIIYCNTNVRFVFTYMQLSSSVKKFYHNYSTLLNSKTDQCFNNWRNLRYLFLSTVGICQRHNKNNDIKKDRSVQSDKTSGFGLEIELEITFQGK